MQDPLDEDAELVARAQAAAGDLRPFEALVRRHESKVLANCRYLTGSADDAQDLAQDVFVKVYFGLRNFRSESRFATWVQRIKVNHCLNFLRQRKKQQGNVEVEDPEVAADPALQVAPAADEETAAWDRRRRIAAALDRIPETLRLPLVMCDLDEMPYQEIADELGIGLSAVKMRIKRGREAFREAYAAMETGA